MADNFLANGPLVTVYIPCRNYGRFLRQAIESVQRQLYANWEIILFDEASKDDTHEIADDFQRADPARIQVVHNATPRGLQWIANRAIETAKGKYLVRLDADDWLDESALLAMVAKLESDPALGLVYGNYYYTDAEGNILGVERGYDIDAEETSGHLPPHGACTMVRTRALKAVGGYSEDINAQDGWELWFKLRGRVKAANLDTPIFYYRQHTTSLSRDSQRLLMARTKILARLCNTLEGSYKPTCLAVIGVRESYPDFPGVPYHQVDGQSLLERAVRSASEATRVTDVVVTSESEAVLAFSEQLERDGRVPPHRRQLRQVAAAESAVPLREILSEASAGYRAVHACDPDSLAFLSIHAFNRRAEHVDKALSVLRLTECDSVVSVHQEREPVFSHGQQGLRLLNPGRLEELSYVRERLYRFNGAILALWNEVIEMGSLLGESVAYIEMSAKDSVQLKADTVSAFSL
ncbi:glycosyltransferase [Sphingomonas sp. ST-64]|uniref:Glycosyltransferase n=1 Tax=Sphingomonas plantiphila TaxID=3163295 RepID=A0ABW8YIQ4_9SPHN